MQTVDNKQPNKLINEKSPYLLQHAYNPVDWYPWCSEVFEVAKKENKPIFLSIGYSTCHWCHVMEQESFEDPDVARLMNESFVSIKVDREERPDIDNLYMSVCQMLTGSGGWPLTVIMTPDKKPFFAGTYFPKETKYGRIGMMDLILKLKEIWSFKQDEVLASADRIVELIKQSTANITSDELLNKEILESAFYQLRSNFDRTFGGFGSAPKFPMPHYLSFLLRYWKRTKNNEALFMVEKTLQKMWLGGIYDHVGFGFHRYSTDSRWLLPHFEKMLYDQTLLSMAYLETFQVTKNEIYKKIAREIFTFVTSEMISKEGGFISAYDADSEGKEGKYYTWTCSELRELLSKDEMDFITKVFNLKEDGNYCEESTINKAGENIFYMEKLPFEISLDLGISLNEFCEKLNKIRQKISTARKKRTYLHKDDKILTSWNGLMIAALAKGSQVLGDSSFTSYAQNAASFILDKLIIDDRLMHFYRDGEAKVFANLDDYSFLIWGLLDLYETVFLEKYLEIALKLNEYIIKHFWDTKNGGFFFTGDDVEPLFIRQKDLYDGAIPSSNSVMILNLLRLFGVTRDNKFKELAENVVKAFSIKVKEMPVAYTQFLCALDYLFGGLSEVVIVGSYNNDVTQLMLNYLRKEFLPNKVVLLSKESELSKITHIAPYIKDLISTDNKVTAYVCRDYTCSMPVTDVNKLIALLS